MPRKSVSEPRNGVISFCSSAISCGSGFGSSTSFGILIFFASSGSNSWCALIASLCIVAKICCGSASNRAFASIATILWWRSASNALRASFVFNLLPLPVPSFLPGSARSISLRYKTRRNRGRRAGARAHRGCA